MTKPPECIHELALCTVCGGLEATRMDLLRGATSIEITFTDGSITRGPATVYIGPVPEPCEKPQQSGV